MGGAASNSSQKIYSLLNKNPCSPKVLLTSGSTVLVKKREGGGRERGDFYTGFVAGRRKRLIQGGLMGVVPQTNFL